VAVLKTLPKIVFKKKQNL